MRGISGTRNISYRSNLDVYEVVKRINGKLEYFGRFHNLDDAIKCRDYFIEHDWDLKLRLIHTTNKNIKFRRGKWIIYKNIDYKEYYFGSFNTYYEAETRLKEIRLKGWEKVILDNERLIETTTSNIIQLPNGKFEIVRYSNGEKNTFGVFNTYEEAQSEVKLLRKCNWDYDALCESIDETINGHLVNESKFGTFFEKHESRNDYYMAVKGGWL